MEPDLCHIDKVEPRETPFSPILINFDYGHHPEKETAEIQCDTYVDPEDHLKQKLVVTRNGQAFIGKLPSEEEPLCQSLLLIRNRKTNKARAVFLKSCNLISITKEEEVNNRKKFKPSIVTAEEKNVAANFLRQQFGSKKSKRTSEMGLRINVDISGKEAKIRETVSNINVKLNEVINENDGNEELLKLIPSCRRDAKMVEEVYDVNDIINDAEQKSLKPQAEFLIQNGLTEGDEKNSFFMFSHYTLLDEKPNIDKAILLIYANSLYKFYNMTAVDLKQKNVLTHIHPNSRPVAMRILNDFTVLTKAGRTRPSFYKDKLVCHLMVVILLFADFKINLDTLSSCLKGFGFKKLLQLARVVGLVPVGSFRSTKSFVLKVPLPSLPKPRLPKKRATVSF